MAALPQGAFAAFKLRSGENKNLKIARRSINEEKQPRFITKSKAYDYFSKPSSNQNFQYFRSSARAWTRQVQREADELNLGSIQPQFAS
jgi:hypothetical protein